MSGSEEHGSRAGEGRPIVVGFDGSACSVAALRWAVQQARATGHPVRVVTTWQWPNLYGSVMILPPEMEPERDARQVLDEGVASVLGDAGDVDVSTEVVEGHPSVVLVEESSRAELLVVGSRGHGEIVGMLIGSVSEFLATHAHCPVVVVRCPVE